MITTVENWKTYMCIIKWCGVLKNEDKMIKWWHFLLGFPPLAMVKIVKNSKHWPIFFDKSEPKCLISGLSVPFLKTPLATTSGTNLWPSTQYKTLSVTFYIVLIVTFGGTVWRILLRSTINHWTGIMQYTNFQQGLWLLGKLNIFGGHHAWILLLRWSRHWWVLIELMKCILDSTPRQWYRGRY